MGINVYTFHHIPMAYLKRRAFHPHTCCGVLITQNYTQILWFFIQQSFMELVIMRLCMGIQKLVITHCVVKEYATPLLSRPDLTEQVGTGGCPFVL